MRRQPRVFTAGLLACSAWIIGHLLAGPLWADVTREQRAEITQLKVALRKAGVKFNERQFEESATLVRDAQARYAKLTQGAEADLLRQADPVFKSLQKAHALLEFEGISMPKLAAPSAAPEPGGVSFTKQVAPLLVTKCGRCHIENARGMVSLVDYGTLMKGPSEGVIVIPNDADGSRIVEVIETGDMPRGGAKLSEEELGVIKQWITVGAKFDGEDPAANLTTFAPDASPAPRPMVEVTKATGNETVDFSADVAPVLIEQCLGCHGGGQRAQANFNLASFRGLLRGGDSGSPLLPKNSADSLLIKKLKGTGGGERMPRGRPPLSDELIGKIATWIDEGATFDGANDQQNIAVVAAVSRARRQSHEELSNDRATLAEANWNLAMPGIPMTVVETENFRLVGTMSQTVLSEFGAQAETLVPKIRAIFKSRRRGPLVKGRMTVYLMNQRFDYSEFGKMVEKRDLPSNQRAHWTYDVIDAYAALVAPRETSEMDAVLGEQIAGVYVASFGATPAWFAEGASRVVASRLRRDDPRVLSWNERLPASVASMSKPDDFIKSRLSGEDNEIAAYGFVGSLMANNRSFQRLLAGMEEGLSFDDAFQQAFGRTAEELVPAWAVRMRRR